LCDRGWTGKECTVDIDECSPNPCKNNGDCVQTFNASYLCGCEAGYTGVNCTENIDDCQNNSCQSNSSCIDKLNGYDCICPAGLKGIHCQSNSSWCEGPSPCFNGNCTDVGDNYTCACLPGYTGQRCETGEKHSSQDYRCKVLFARANFSNNDLLKILILPICNNFSVIWLKLHSVSNASEGSEQKIQKWPESFCKRQILT